LIILKLLLSMIDHNENIRSDGSSQNRSGVHDFRKIPPGPGWAPPLSIGKYDQFELRNGLKIILVQNHKLPKISIQFLLDLPPLSQGDKVGYIDITAEMLLKGTIHKSKAAIDETVDWMAAVMNARADGLYASFLSKHLDMGFSLFSEILRYPSFPEDELDKLKTRTISALLAGKDDPNKIASNVANVLRYSKYHPYGELTTEGSVRNIQLNLCKAHYQKYFRPNNGYLAIVGDITLKEAKDNVERHFASWEPMDSNIPVPIAPVLPVERSVFLVDKPGAVQSVALLTHPVLFAHDAPDRMAAMLMNTLLGGFFKSRINANLREDKGYTYGASSALSPDRYVGAFTAGGSFGTDVTVAATGELIFEIQRMRTELISDEELSLVKASMSGNFARSLEKPQTIANFALNIARYHLPVDYYERYLDRLMAIEKEEVLAAAQKYLSPEQSFLIVVGNRQELEHALARWASSGKTSVVDQYGNELNYG